MSPTWPVDVTVPRRPTADDDLAPDNYESLNGLFYVAEPHDYFNQRLGNLMLVASKNDALDELLRHGIRIGELTYGHVDDPDPPPLTPEARADSAKVASNFVTAEAEILLHHIGETLLRLYLAHESFPPCPWLELSRIHSAGEFKRMVRRRFGDTSKAEDPTNLAAVARVFHGTADPTTFNRPLPEGRWEADQREIESFLRYFAHTFLTSAPLYNAAKHGLAFTPSESSMKWNDGSVVSADGPVIWYLEAPRNQAGIPRWQKTAQWIEIDQRIALMFRAVHLLSSLWEVARARYLPHERGKSLPLHLFDSPPLLTFLPRGKGTGIVIETMSIELGYYLPESEVRAPGLAKRRRR